MTRELHLLDHPLVQHKLTLLRDKEVSTRGFRALTEEIGALLAYEIMRDAPTRPVEVQTPLGLAKGVELDGKKLVLVTIHQPTYGYLRIFAAGDGRSNNQAGFAFEFLSATGKTTFGPSGPPRSFTPTAGADPVETLPTWPSPSN